MPGASSASSRLRLLGSFELSAGSGPLTLSRGSQRLLAYLALNPQPVDRAVVAGILWPWKPQDRAQANLRAALWRLPRLEPTIVVCVGRRIALDERTECDVRELERVAQRAMFSDDDEAALDPRRVLMCAVDLLPDWDEDWLVIDRERLRQLRLLALDAMTNSLIERGDFGVAVMCALLAVKTEPLRESSQRALVAAHIATGNYSEARRQFASYVELLRRELDARPSEEFAKLLDAAIGR